MSRGSPDVPIPMATIDSPSAMITINANRSAKCDGETRHLDAGDCQRADDVDHERSKPHPGAVVRIDEAAYERDDGRDDEPGCEPAHRAEEHGVAAHTPGVERRVQHAHDEVRHGEPGSLVLEGVGDGERHEEPGRHRREHDHSRDRVLDVDRVGHPRVGRPRPPHHREHERRAGESLRSRVLEDERCHLREREHEHEIEEQLEVAGLALLFLVGRLPDVGRDVGHAPGCETARSRNSTESGAPEACSTRRSQRIDSPGA